MSTARCWCALLMCVSVMHLLACSEEVISDSVASGITAGVAPEASLVTSTETSLMRMLSLQETAPVFRVVAASMVGVPIFGVRSLPEGVEVAEAWWPVIEGRDEGVEGRSDVNPRVVGEGGEEPEGQVVLRSDNGWFVVVENFRGDLGEVAGGSVGSVAGQSAYLYEVNGGWLVQWAFEGRWYCVFGRDVGAEAVRALALDMALLKGH